MTVIEIDKVTKEFRLGQITSFGQNIKGFLAKLHGQKNIKKNFLLKLLTMCP